jgi:hypothetical protein
MSASRAGLVALLIAVCLPRPADAQCPSNASSCVVCHEGGERPPNADGTPWHTDHAFADQCVACHGGDRERMDATAHEGTIDPLTNPEITCVACHEDGVLRALTYLASREDRDVSPAAVAPLPAPPTKVSAADGVLLLLATLLGLALVLLTSGVRPTPSALLRGLRASGWPPALAGTCLGVVVAISEAACGRPIAVSGGVDRLAAYAGATLFPQSSYYRFVVPPAITWQVWLLVGLVAGAATSALLSGTARWRWLPDSGWTETHGPSRARRLALAFLGAVLVQVGAGIAGGCTSGLAISGGALLAPAAFLFVAGMFAGGIPTAWLWSRRSP